MRRNGTRVTELKKEKLIARIKENKQKHIEAYDKAVIAYRRVALEQLADLTVKVKSGDMTVRLNLTTPIDNRENYDKIIEMFEWDIKDIVELDQDEYNEYILDETATARQALMSNTMYLG
jgi:hypothetical protein